MRLLAIDLVTAIGGTGPVRQLTINGAPWSKGRPRFSRNGHTYVRQQDREAEDATRTALRLAFPIVQGMGQRRESLPSGAKEILIHPRSSPPAS